MEVPATKAQKSGIIRPTPDGGMAGLAERPKPGTAPSRPASVGRNVLEPEHFDILPALPPGHGGEI
ncbi:MAG: hypothetical protein JJT95_06445 [Pararhodobacter sp.]|nr:hypothetical protein [Pararhodobacter sp.]